MLFVVEVFKVLKFSDFINEIRIFLLKIIFYKDIRDDDKRLGIVYVYEVDIECKRK